MSYTLYADYTVGSVGASYGYGAIYKGELFPVSIAHPITSVKVQIYRLGSPGTITCNIYAVDGSNYPTGAALVTGTTNGNTLTTETTGELREITVSGAGDDLTVGNYAIVLTCVGNVANRFSWLYDNYSATGYGKVNSVNSGATWGTTLSETFLFEEYGIPIPVTEVTALEEALVTGSTYSDGAGILGDYLYLYQHGSTGKIVKIKLTDYTDITYSTQTFNAYDALVVVGSTLWVGDYDGYLYKVSPTTLEILETYGFLANGITALCTDGTYIYGAGRNDYGSGCMVGSFKVSDHSIKYSNVGVGVGAGYYFHSLGQDTDYIYGQINSTAGGAAVYHVLKMAKADIAASAPHTLTPVADVTTPDNVNYDDDIIVDSTGVYLQAKDACIDCYAIADLAVTRIPIPTHTDGMCLSGTLLLAGESTETATPHIYIIDTTTLKFINVRTCVGVTTTKIGNELLVSGLYLHYYRSGYSGPAPVDRFTLSEVLPQAGEYTLPVPTTQAVSAITSSTATGNGNITSDGGGAITERGVCWSTNHSPTIANSKATHAGTTGAYDPAMTGLTTVTKYYVRAYATNIEGTSYGNEVEFTTEAVPPTTPLVETSTAVVAGSTSAIGGATVTSAGGGTITERGVCIKATANPEITDTKFIASGTGLGVFTVGITGLTANTLYHMRGYATSSDGTGYSDDITFTTSIPVDPGILSVIKHPLHYDKILQRISRRNQK